MTNQQACAILNKLIRGVDPKNGEILPDGHILYDPDVIRALGMGIAALYAERMTPESPAEPQCAVRNSVAPLSAVPERAMPEPPGKPNAGRAWTEADQQELIRLYNSGTSMKEICRRLQRRERSINRQLMYFGLIDSPESKSLRSGLERMGQPWTLDEELKLKQLCHHRLPIEDIARELHRSEYSVYCHMERLDLYGDVPGYPLYDPLPRWTSADNQKLTELFKQGKSTAEIADYFGRSEKSISARMFYMGLTRELPPTLPPMQPALPPAPVPEEDLPEPPGKPNAGRAWTEADQQELIRLYNSGTSMKEICRRLQRRERSINRQLMYFGLIDSPESKSPRSGLERMGRPWTLDEELKLKQLHQHRLPIEDIARELHRSEYGVYCHMERLDLYGDVPGYPLYDPLPRWTSADNQKLTELFDQGKSTAEIADYFGRSEKSISARMFYMGLTRQSPPTLLRRKSEPDENK